MACWGPPVDWHELIADGLPAPRDDEPPSLRQEIADELADHLRCAFDRQRPQAADEESARQAVLEQFGDVRRVARRLWLDAMKERLMSQRLTLGLVAVMAAACLGASFFVSRQAWLAVQEGQRVNEAILERLARMPAASESAPLDWTPVGVKLVQKDRTTGTPSPADGFSVRLSGRLYRDSTDDVLDLVTGTDGTVDFGLVHPGQYSLNLSSPWQESYSTMITAIPGRPASEMIVCPAAPPQRVPISVELKWPDDIPRERFLVGCTFDRRGRMIGGGQWMQYNQPDFAFLIGPSGQLQSFSEFLPAMAPVAPRSGRSGYTSLLGTYISGDQNPPGDPSDPLLVKMAESQPVATPLHWPEGQYVLFQFALAAIPEPDQPLSGQTLHLIAGHPTRSGLSQDPERATKLGFLFQADAQKPNRWVIALPPETETALRAYLRNEPKAPASRVLGPSP